MGADVRPAVVVAMFSPMPTWSTGDTFGLKLADPKVKPPVPAPLSPLVTEPMTMAKIASFVKSPGTRGNRGRRACAAGSREGGVHGRLLSRGTAVALAHDVLAVALGDGDGAPGALTTALAPKQANT